MLEIDATTRGRLVDLRRMLREGQARAQDRTSTGQHIAIVLLDAACEHVVALGRAQRGLGRVNHVESAAKELFAAVGEGWQPRGAKGFIELHQQRNAAQHHGIRPDMADVARWADDAASFADSLIHGILGVELADVAVADSVQHEGVRRLLREAERALDDGDYAEAKYAAVDAFDAARALWKGLRPRPGVPWHDARERNMPEGVLADLETLRDQAEVQPFATDFGEYLWLVDQHRRYHRRAPVPIEDALRALAFVTEWVLRWEAHVARRIDRDAEWLAQQQPAVSGEPDATPSVHRIAVAPDAGAEHVDPALVRVKVTLQDLPREQRAQWCFFAADSLSGRLSGFASRGATCDETGVLSFEVSPDSTHLEELLPRIEDSLEEASARWRDYCADEHAAEARAARLLSECRNGLAPWLADDSRLRSVELSPGRRDAVRVHFNAGLDSREAYWMLELLRRRFGEENPGAHRIELGDDWADVPFPEHDDAVGRIIASVLEEFDRFAAEHAKVRGDLEDFAERLQVRLVAHLVDLRDGT